MAPAILPKKMIRSAILIRGHRRKSFDEIVEEPPFGIAHVLCVGPLRMALLSAELVADPAAFDAAQLAQCRRLLAEEARVKGLGFRV